MHFSVKLWLAVDQHGPFMLVVLYPIGVPCFMLIALWPYRKELSDVASRKSEYAKSRHLSFFCADYKGARAWLG